jgi:hypothetical protein
MNATIQVTKDGPVYGYHDSYAADGPYDE